MNHELVLQIDPITAEPRFDGKEIRTDFIHVDSQDFEIYHSTQGKTNSLDGDSKEFIDFVGCQKCPVSGNLCKPYTDEQNNGRLVSFDTSEFSEEFPCYGNYYDGK